MVNVGFCGMACFPAEFTQVFCLHLQRCPHKVECLQGIDSRSFIYPIRDIKGVGIPCSVDVDEIGPFFIEF